MMTQNKIPDLEPENITVETIKIILEDIINNKIGDLIM